MGLRLSFYAAQATKQAKSMFDIVLGWLIRAKKSASSWSGVAARVRHPRHIQGARSGVRRRWLACFDGASENDYP
jgi:hypothetical protein